MRYLRSYLDTAQKIAEQYDGKLPLNAFLKQYFSQQKKHGSRDRKAIAALCYYYYRISLAMPGQPLQQKLLAAAFMSANHAHEAFTTEWNDKISLTLREKAFAAGVSLSNLFPNNEELSAGIDASAFQESFLIQPDLFIRIRPGREKLVLESLKENDVYYEKINESCLAFENSTKLEDILTINRDAVIQDASSQRVAGMFGLMQLPARAPVWDCCAASGGKSIMAADTLNNISLTVSDVRPSIIHNLRKRLSEAGITKYQALVADATNENDLIKKLAGQKFNLIIFDAPCTGSGTWGRTPEQLYFFTQDKILHYSRLQRAIAANAIKYLAKGGYFLYITCSVFKKENEEIADFISTDCGLTMLTTELIKGYHIKADTMFTALFQK